MQFIGKTDHSKRKILNSQSLRLLTALAAALALGQAAWGQTSQYNGPLGAADGATTPGGMCLWTGAPTRGAVANNQGHPYRVAFRLSDQAPGGRPWIDHKVVIESRHGAATGGPILTVTGINGDHGLAFTVAQTSDPATGVINWKGEGSAAALPAGPGNLKPGSTGVSLQANVAGMTEIRTTVIATYRTAAGQLRQVSVTSGWQQITWRVAGAMLGAPGAGNVQVAVSDWSGAGPFSAGSELPTAISVVVPEGTSVDDLRVQMHVETVGGTALSRPYLGYDAIDFDLTWASSGSSLWYGDTYNDLGTVESRTLQTTQVAGIAPNAMFADDPDYMPSIPGGDLVLIWVGVDYIYDGESHSITLDYLVPLESDWLSVTNGEGEDVEVAAVEVQ